MVSPKDTAHEAKRPRLRLGSLFHSSVSPLKLNTVSDGALMNPPIMKAVLPMVVSAASKINSGMLGSSVQFAPGTFRSPKHWLLTTAGRLCPPQKTNLSVT